MTGWLRIVGLGPGADVMITPQVREALADASDVYGYATYVKRIAPRAGLVVHPSDNREELTRARAALAATAAGRRVVIVSSGDPGVFAMGAAVFEAMEDNEHWQRLDVAVLPGVTAMLAAAAAAGAPLGHDFCAINLSDNLKPWRLIEKRLALAVEADFAIAIYNPRSKSRPETFNAALDVIARAGGADRLVILVRNAGLPDQVVMSGPLNEIDVDSIDMRTLVIVGSSATTRVGRWVYTPRRAS
ncbi:MAG TPA: precorrin-3B C(17)-methyltransferase [Hyphomicrobiaceae bacterium]|nr:precorrin-3B C(17)-methyltransferase [Hyphomicrobiaceae bacterium]